MDKTNETETALARPIQWGPKPPEGHVDLIIPAAAGDLYHELESDEDGWYKMPPNPIVGWRVGFLGGADAITLRAKSSDFEFVIERGGLFWTEDGLPVASVEKRIQELNDELLART